MEAEFEGARFALEVHLWPAQDGPALEGRAVYRAGALEATTVARLVSQLENLLAGAVVFFYLEAGLFKWLLLLLILLLALRESKRLIRQRIIRLRLASTPPGIEVEQGGQPYFFAKYKVYANRWFAILKLIDESRTRTLVLNSDCFSSDRHYRQLRYRLQGSESEYAA